MPYSSNGTKANEFAQTFTNLFEGSADVPIDVPSQTPMTDVSNFVLALAKNSTYAYTRKCVVGASFYDQEDKVETVLQFNGQPLHSPAIALAALDTSIVRYLTDHKDVRLNVVNDPLPDSYREQVTGSRWGRKKKKKNDKTAEKKKKGRLVCLGCFGIRFKSLSPSIV